MLLIFPRRYFCGGSFCFMSWCFIRKTCPCNVYPLKPHFYIAKLGYAGVYLFFLFLLQNIDCGYSLEPPRRGGSNVYPQKYVLSKNKKKYQKFPTEIFQFLQLKKSLYITWVCFRNEFFLCAVGALCMFSYF